MLSTWERMSIGSGLGPNIALGPRMEPGLPPRMRDRPIRGPAILLHTLDKRGVHVRVCGRVVRHHGHGPTVHDRRVARVEHVVTVQDEKTAAAHGGWWRRQ